LRDGVVPQKTLLPFTDVPESQMLIPLKSQKTEGYSALLKIAGLFSAEYPEGK
jgi:hypothetical protein